jgi:predicted Na+-dependent transporter
MAAYVVSAVFLLVGILGFIPGVTTQYDQMEFWSEGSEAMLLGIFMVSVLHNLVHLAFGIVGFAMASRPGGAKAYLIGGGLVYLALWIYGLVIDLDSQANFVPLNEADNWLHLGLAIGMVLLGLLPSGARSRVGTVGNRS